MYPSFTLQIVAALTLLVYGILVCVATVLVLHNFGIAIAFALTITLLSYTVLTLLTTDKKLRWTKYIIAVIASLALVAELGYFFADKNNRQATVLLLILSVLYVGLFTSIRSKYRQEVRKASRASGRRAHFQNPFLIINPSAGNGRAIKVHLAETAQEQGINVLYTGQDVSVTDAVNQAVTAGADVLGISGGDGSIGAVAKVALAQKLPIVVLPGGTRCHFARDLGLEPGQITDALAGFTGVERYIDVADINGRIFVNNASFGLYADIVDHPEYREHKVDVIQNTLGSMAVGTKPLYDLGFRHGKLRFRKAVQVLVGVNRYNLINIFELGRRERLDEGVLQITAITQVSAQATRRLLRPINMQKLEKRRSALGFYQWVSRTFRIVNDSEKIVVGVDGEREEYANPVTIRIHPRALRVFVPVEIAHGRPKNPFRFVTLQNALHSIMHPALW